jgi:CRP-like cAMP-binding protein
MTRTTPDADLTFDELTTIDQLCDEFEAAWGQSHGHESIAAWVDRVPERLRATLFAELLTIDGQLRARREETSSLFSLSEICPFDIILPPPGKGDRDDNNAMASISTARRALIGCPTFAGLSRKAANRLEESFVERRFAKNEPLMNQGQPTQGLFIVVTGRLVIRKFADDSAVGESTVIDRCGPGSVLGEMSLLTGKECSATVIATTEVTTLSLSSERFAQLRLVFPEIEIALSQLVSDRLGRREIDALCGRSLGGYRLQKCIGRGGMGVVYQCHPDADPTRPLALKMLRHRFVHEPTVVELFQRESSVLQRLDHPNVIKVYDSFVDVSTRFLVLELCNGIDLREALSRHGRLNEATVRAIAGQIAAGLLYAHSQHVIHMDIKPENILLDRTGRAAIADFGLCQSGVDDSSEQDIKGTPAYMSPEQLSGDVVDHRSDWYSMGCLLVELMTGERLFQERNAISLLRVKMSTKPSSSWPKWTATEPLRSMVAGWLQPNPNDRRCDAQEVVAWAANAPELVQP